MLQKISLLLIVLLSAITQARAIERVQLDLQNNSVWLNSVNDDALQITIPMKPNHQPQEVCSLIITSWGRTKEFAELNARLIFQDRNHPFVQLQARVDTNYPQGEIAIDFNEEMIEEDQISIIIFSNPGERSISSITDEIFNKFPVPISLIQCH